MKTVFLSPSTQEHNVGPEGYNEEEQMNLVADEVERVLKTIYGIKVLRNNSDASLGDAVRASIAAHPNAHIAIHSNSGGGRGCEVYYNKHAKDLAEVMYKSVSAFTPTSDRGIKNGNHLYELVNLPVPGVLIEVEFHDNKLGAAFIMKHTKQLGRTIADSIAEYFDVHPGVLKK